jgi:hypothetical protein
MRDEVWTVWIVEIEPAHDGEAVGVFVTRLPDEVLEARIADLPFAEDTAQRLMAMARD